MLDDRGIKLTYDLDKNNGTGNMSDGESFDSITYGETNKLNEWVTKYMRCKNNHLRCVIIGKTGTGKSATLNSISGQDLFMSKRQAKALTQTCQTETVQQFSRTLTLVDTPGMFDSETPIDKTQKEIARCIELTLPGPHLVFFTMRMDSRFSADDRDTVKAYIKQFGIEIMKHTIILLTHYKSGDDTNAFVTDVQNLIPYLKTHDKFMPFDNMLEGDMAAEQLKNLENIINGTLQKNNGRYYTNEQYEARARVICEEIHKEEERKQKEIEQEFQRARDQEREKVQKESNEKIRKYLRYTTTGVKIAADVALPGSGIVIEGSQLIYCLAKRDTAGIKEHAFGAVLSGFFLLGGGLLAKEATAVYNAKVLATPVTEAGKVATKTFTEEFVGQAVKRIISPLGGVTKAVYNTFNTDDRQKDSNTHPHM